MRGQPRPKPGKGKTWVPIVLGVLIVVSIMQFLSAPKARPSPRRAEDEDFASLSSFAKQKLPDHPRMSPRDKDVIDALRQRREIDEEQKAIVAQPRDKDYRFGDDIADRDPPPEDDVVVDEPRDRERRFRRDPQGDDEAIERFKGTERRRMYDDDYNNGRTRGDDDQEVQEHTTRRRRRVMRDPVEEPEGEEGEDVRAVERRRGRSYPKRRSSDKHVEFDDDNTPLREEIVTKQAAQRNVVDLEEAQNDLGSPNRGDARRDGHNGGHNVVDLGGEPENGDAAETPVPVHEETPLPKRVVTPVKLTEVHFAAKSRVGRHKGYLPAELAFEENAKLVVDDAAAAATEQPATPKAVTKKEQKPETPKTQKPNDDPVVRADGYYDPPHAPTLEPLAPVRRTEAGPVDFDSVDSVFMYSLPTESWLRDASDFVGKGVAMREATDVLQYSLRSIWHNANWTRFIHVVVPDDSHVPKWFNPKSKRVRFVTHFQIFPKGVELPTFNSNAIEACLHRIPGLSRHFVYLRPDMLFPKPAPISYFVTEKDNPRLFIRDDPKKQCRLRGVEVECKANQPALPDDFIVAYNRLLVWDYFRVEASHVSGNTPQLMDRRVLHIIEERLKAVQKTTLANRAPGRMDVHIPTVFPFAAVKIYNSTSVDGFSLRTNVEEWKTTLNIDDVAAAASALKTASSLKEKPFLLVVSSDPMVLQSDDINVRKLFETLTSAEPAVWERQS